VSQWIEDAIFRDFDKILNAKENNMQDTNVLAVNAISQTVRPGFVSDNYGFIKTAPIVQRIEQYGWKLVSTQIAKARKDEKKGFERHKLIFEHPTLGLDADSRPRLYLLNSHDRSKAFQFNLGFLRFVCENGIMAGEAIGAQFKVYHTGKKIEEQIGSQLISALNSVPKLLQLREQMRRRKLSHAEITALSYRIKQLTAKVRGLEQIDGETFNVVRRPEDEGTDAWTVFNALQESAIRGNFEALRLDRKTGTHTRIKAKSIKAIDADAKLNKVIFDETINFLKIGA
jgi:hypothetical protein